MVLKELRFVLRAVALCVLEVTRSVVNDDLVKKFAQLSAVEYGGESDVADPAHLRWKFISDPAGVAYSDFLTKSDDQGNSEVIGRIVYEPRVFRSAAGECRAVNPIDLLIHPHHRSPRAFLELMRGLREHEEVDLIYFSPNAVSAPLYDRVLKFSEVGSFVLTGMPLRVDRVLGNRIPRWLHPAARLLGAAARGALRLLTIGAKRGITLSDSIPEPAQIDQLANAVTTGTTWVGSRDYRFHQWRFHESPRYQYRVRYAKINDELVGYLASRVTDFEGQRACIIIDCLVSGSKEKRIARALLADTLRWAMTEQADLIAALSFGEGQLTRSLRQLPLLRIPHRFWPHPAPVLAEYVGAPTGAEAPKISLTLADLDVF